MSGFLPESHLVCFNLEGAKYKGVWTDQFCLQIKPRLKYDVYLWNVPKQRRWLSAPRSFQETLTPDGPVVGSWNDDNP